MARLMTAYPRSPSRSPAPSGAVRASLDCSKPGCRERNFWMQRQSAKIATKMRERRQRPKIQEVSGGNPRRNALFGVVSETCGLRRLDGGDSRARTGDPPPSHRTESPPKSGTEISDAETGGQKRTFYPAETRPETSLIYEKPPFQRVKCNQS